MFGFIGLFTVMTIVGCAISKKFRSIVGVMLVSVFELIGEIFS